MNTPKTPAETRFTEALDRMDPARRDRVVQTAREAKARTDAPSIKLDLQGDSLTIDFDCDHPEIATLLQMADMGSTDRHFHNGVIGQIACLGSRGRGVDAANANFVFAVVRAVKPRDELEALLAVQMGTIHAASMMMARKLNHVTTIQQQDSAERALNKLTRTYAMQMDTLKRYRTGGQQKVTVEHVTVNAGGQAIVGAVQTGGGGEG